MNQLERTATEFITLRLFQMLGQSIAAMQSRGALEIAVIGQTGPIQAVGELIFRSEPARLKLTYLDRASSKQTPFLESFSAKNFDAVVIVETTIEAEEELLRSIRDRVASEGGVLGSILLWSRLYSTVIQTFLNLGPLPTCLNHDKMIALAAAAYLSQPSGTIFECGVYKGGTTVYLATLERKLGSQRRLFALDTFTGMPAPGIQDAADGDTAYAEGYFGDTAIEGVRQLYEAHGCNSQISVIQGRVEETFPTVLSDLRECSFAFLDMDQYAGIYFALRNILELSTRQPLILIDDVGILGVDKAIQDATRGFCVARVNLTTNVDLVVPIGGPSMTPRNSAP